MESLELPEEGDYEEFLEREGLRPRPAAGGHTWVVVTGAILVFALVLALVFSLVLL